MCVDADVAVWGAGLMGLGFGGGFLGGFLGRWQGGARGVASWAKWVPTFVGFSLRFLPLRDSGSVPFWGLDFGHFAHGFFYLEHSDC